MDKIINLNFGAIKESILKLESRNFFNSERKNINDFISEINSNPTLKKQYLFYKAIDSNKTFEKQRLAERFINQTLEILNGLKWVDIISENKALRTLFLNETYVGSTTNKDALYNAIHTLLEAKLKGINNYDQTKEQEAYDFVLNHLMQEKEIKIMKEQEEPEPNWSFITQLAINNFKERYAHLNEEEIKLVKILTSTYKEKENYLELLKQDNLKKIKENNSEEKETLKSFEHKIDSLIITPLNIDESIMNFFKLKNLI